MSVSLPLTFTKQKKCILLQTESERLMFYTQQQFNEDSEMNERVCLTEEQGYRNAKNIVSKISWTSTPQPERSAQIPTNLLFWQNYISHRRTVEMNRTYGRKTRCLSLSHPHTVIQHIWQHYVTQEAAVMTEIHQTSFTKEIYNAFYLWLRVS